MFFTPILDVARQAHADRGGYLLQTFFTSSTHSDAYVVCDEQEAVSLGRTPEQLAALAPTYDETRRGDGLADDDTAALADDHEAAQYEDDGEAAYGRED